jgi:hypothetical protein
MRNPCKKSHSGPDVGVGQQPIEFHNHKVLNEEPPPATTLEILGSQLGREGGTEAVKVVLRPEEERLDIVSLDGSGVLASIHIFHIHTLQVGICTFFCTVYMYMKSCSTTTEYRRQNMSMDEI